MKNLMYMLAILFTTGLYAQDKPKEVIKETEVKTVKTKDSKGTKEQKIAITTKKEMEVETKTQDGHYENSNRVETPVMISKTVKVDRDNDPFYDSETEVVVCSMNDTDFSFTKNNSGFDISCKANQSYGNAKLTSINGYYLYNTDEYSGIGYFNKDGDFVVEYYDANTDSMATKVFNIK